MSKTILVIGLALILYLIPATSISQECGTCECCFDNPDYKAKGECDLVCTVYMDTTKECTIVCDGSPPTESRVPLDRRYLNKIGEIRGRMLVGRFEAFQNWSFSQEAMPALLRAGYIGVVTTETIRELDNQINEVFQNVGPKAWSHFTQQIGIMDEQVNKIRIRVRFKKFELSFRRGQRLNLFIVK